MGKLIHNSHTSYNTVNYNNFLIFQESPSKLEMKNHSARIKINIFFLLLTI